MTTKTTTTDTDGTDEGATQARSADCVVCYSQILHNTRD